MSSEKTWFCWDCRCWADAATHRHADDAETPFLRVIREVVEMHDRKQLDYGRDSDPFANVRASEDFGIPGWVGSVVRANDKMRRLQKAAQGGSLANEGIRDSLLDAAVYFLIATVLFDEATEGR